MNTITYSNTNFNPKPLDKEVLAEMVSLLKLTEEERQKFITDLGQYFANNGYQVIATEYLPKGHIWIGTGEKDVVSPSSNIPK